MPHPTTPPPAGDDYILGTEQRELERLHFQHQVWVQQAYALFARAGLRAGETVLDLGCGPGFTTLELAHVIGPTGRVIAADQSERFLAHLRGECQRLGMRQVDPRLGPIELLELRPGELDAAYSRWLLCWLADAGAVLERVTAALRPGGRILLQEYIDWGAMQLVPHGDAFARAVQACLRSFADGGATIDLSRHVPVLAARCGLRVEHFAPVARIGGVGSLEWRWIETFFSIYLPKVRDRGLLSAAEVEAWRAEWQQRAGAGRSFVVTPMVADVILQKP